MSLWFLTQWKVSIQIRKGVSLRLKLKCLTVVGIFFQYATGQNRIDNMPKFSINECNEKLFKLPNA